MSLEDDTLTFDFVGKEHLDRHVQVADPVAAALVREVLSVPRRDDALPFVTGDPDNARHAEHRPY